MRDRSSFRKRSAATPRVECEPVNIAAEMQLLVREAAASIAPGETIKAQMRRAWLALGRPATWRLRAAWYGEAGCWSARAVEDMRARAARAATQEEKGRAKAAELAAIYHGAAARLAQTDADFHREQIAGLEHAARAVGGLDRAVAAGGVAPPPE
jgi:hypothetical protein